MKLSIGIIGLPNVGKSTLFNALLKKQVADVANYPFCTIEPNIGIVEVPDERLSVLAKIVNTSKIVPAVVEFYDIAGLVKGASQGEGLGNKFLSHIKEVASVAHVVRFFDDKNVAHISSAPNPLDDIKTIETELILADLQTIEKQKKPKTNALKDEIFTYKTLQKIKEFLNKEIPIRNISLTEDEKQAIKQFNFLTEKPVIFVFNVSEQQLQKKQKLEEKIQNILKKIQSNNSINNHQSQENNNYIFLSAKLESEISVLNSQEQQEYLKQYDFEESGLNRLIKKTYEILGLISFLTAGEKEVKAWTVKKGALALQAAGTIHSDFEKHFIKADVIPYEKFVEAGGWIKARELGLVQTVGKDYEIKDGDVVEFKINT